VPVKFHRQLKSIARQNPSIVKDDKSESWNDLDETHPAAGDARRSLAERTRIERSRRGRSAALQFARFVSAV
jgi:hypothetical protein